MRKLLFALAALMLVTAFQVEAGEEWSLSRDKEGIKVYTRKYADYNYKEYKGIAIVDGTIDEFLTILKDVNTYDKWSFKCVPNSVKLLNKDEGKGLYHVYMEIKAPLVSNRDVVTVYKFNKAEADGSVLVEFWGDADYIPKKMGKSEFPN